MKYTIALTLSMLAYSLCAKSEDNCTIIIDEIEFCGKIDDWKITEISGESLYLGSNEIKALSLKWNLDNNPSLGAWVSVVPLVAMSSSTIHAFPLFSETQYEIEVGKQIAFGISPTSLHQTRTSTKVEKVLMTEINSQFNNLIGDVEFVHELIFRNTKHFVHISSSTMLGKDTVSINNNIEKMKALSNAIRINGTPIESAIQ